MNFKKFQLAKYIENSLSLLKRLAEENNLEIINVKGFKYKLGKLLIEFVNNNNKMIRRNFIVNIYYIMKLVNISEQHFLIEILSFKTVKHTLTI